MANINIDQLGNEIADALSEYSNDVVNMVDITSKKVAKKAVKMLKETSPKKRGKYAKAWAVKTEFAAGQPDNQIIYSKKPYYRLTHLLENGHVKVGGGRVAGKPHIRPVEQQVIKDFTEEVEGKIKNGRTL